MRSVLRLSLIIPHKSEEYQMKELLTIDCQIPGGYGTFEDFYSQRSLLDADFILFRTASLSNHFGQVDPYRGKSTFEETQSFRIRESIEHWHREIQDAVEAGKTVFVILGRLDEVYVRTGERTYSGTGQKRVQTNKVASVSNYDVLPSYDVRPFNELKVVQSEGEAMVLQQGENPLRDYWENYGQQSQYQIYIENSSGYVPLLTTRNGGRIVSAVYRTPSGGAIILLPWIDLDRQDFFSVENDDDDEPEIRWTDEAKGWGSKYIQLLSSIDDAIKKRNDAEPIPPWASDENFMTYQERKLGKELSEIGSEIKKLQGKQKETALSLEDAAYLKPLLFAQGQSLEEAILRAMRLLGFSANHFRDADSEFDAVLECSEGRMIGEAEGKDRRLINIDKMRQLLTNIMEDFAREEVSEEATGALFGNAYRLISPSERPSSQFTTKCAQTAAAHGIVLIPTCDLFDVAKTLVDRPDEDFAAECRKAIFAAKGGAVQFPSIPVARSVNTDS